MTDSELRARLRAIDPDSDPAVEQRAWRVVRGAYTPEFRQRTRRHWRMTVPAVACLLVVAVVLATASPPRDALARWLRDAIGLSTQAHPRPLLSGLPGGGQLLVNSPAGPWIVNPNGRRHYLGPYTSGAWSPHSLYVIAWRSVRLTALDPQGHTQWGLTSHGPISVARWSPDGYRIAYLAGHSLWIVAGDGSENHQLRAEVAPVTPAWQPHSGTEHRIAVVDRRGDLELVNADTGARAWRTRPRGTPRLLLWSPDGTRLLTVAPGRLVLYDTRGHLLATSTSLPGQTFGQAAFAPTGELVALSTSQPSQATASVALLSATRRGLGQPLQVLFSSRERVTGISWSPNDRWLLASSPAADQWIFIRTQRPTQLLAISRIAGLFETGRQRAQAFPTLGGWQRR